MMGCCKNSSLDHVGKGGDGVIRFKSRLCVPFNEELKIKVLHEIHNSKNTIQSRITKMYQGMKRMYWWPDMKRMWLVLFTTT